MAKKIVQKTFQYRYASGLSEGRTLEDLLRQILFNSHHFVADRWETLGGEGADSLKRFINHRRDNKAMIFGQLVVYENGRNREALTVAEKADELPTIQVSLPNSSDGHPQEFLESSLYFGVNGNHIILVQSTSLTGREMENHLRWLISEHAQLMASDENLVIEKELTNNSKAVLKDIKSVVFGTPLYPDEPDSPSPNTATTAAVTTKSYGREVLDSLMGAGFLGNMNIDQFADADIQVELKIKRVGRAQPEDSASKAMAALTSAMRHQHPDDLLIETRNSGRVKGDSLFLSTKRGVTHWNGVPDMEDIFRLMQEWITECLTSGAVTD